MCRTPPPPPAMLLAQPQPRKLESLHPWSLVAVEPINPRQQKNEPGSGAAILSVLQGHKCELSHRQQRLACSGVKAMTGLVQTACYVLLQKQIDLLRMDFSLFAQHALCASILSPPPTETRGSGGKSDLLF